MYFFFYLQETMEDIDKNGDGLIDLEEYIGEDRGIIIFFTMQFVQLFMTK